jgi:hypothetical protein
MLCEAVPRPLNDHAMTSPWTRTEHYGEGRWQGYTSNGKEGLDDGITVRAGHPSRTPQSVENTPWRASFKGDPGKGVLLTAKGSAPKSGPHPCGQRRRRFMVPFVNAWYLVLID